MQTLDLDSVIKKASEELKGTSSVDKARLLLFVSFDLENSTLFKSRAGSAWPAVITFFYNAMATMVKKEVPDIKTWKHLGDEIVFYLDIKNIEDVYDIPDKVFAVQKNALGKICEKHPEAIMLDVKCTLWLAGVIHAKLGDEEYINDKHICKEDQVHRNICIPIFSSNGMTEDFLGIDMDTGFRIAKYSNKQKITLSAEYAYLLYHLPKPANMDKIDDKLKIVAYKELRGIWNGKMYPIVWYYPDWDNIESSFDYDEYITNDIVKNISERKGIQHLEKVFARRKDYMDRFIEACKRYKHKEKRVPVIVGT